MAGGSCQLELSITSNLVCPKMVPNHTKVLARTEHVDSQDIMLTAQLRHRLRIPGPVPKLPDWRNPCGAFRTSAPGIFDPFPQPLEWRNPPSTGEIEGDLAHWQWRSSQRGS